MATIPHPLHISARLMAAYSIPGAGTLHLHASGLNRDGRLTYSWAIDNALGQEVGTGADLHSAPWADIDYLSMMGAFLSFLTAAAEAGEDGENSGLFEPKVMEWAREFSDELSIAALDLEESE